MTHPGGTEDASFLDDIASLLDAVDATLSDARVAEAAGKSVAATPPPEVLADDLALLLLGVKAEDADPKDARISTPRASEERAQGRDVDGRVPSATGERAVFAGKQEEPGDKLQSEASCSEVVASTEHEESLVEEASAKCDSLAAGYRLQSVNTPPAEVLADDLALLLLGVDTEDILTPARSSAGETSPTLNDSTSNSPTDESMRKSESTEQAATPMTTSARTDPNPATQKRAAPPKGSPRGAATRSKMFRRRQREEFEYLRDQVRELEDKLGNLQQTKRSSPQSPQESTNGGVKEESEVPAMPTSAVWERIARHQMSAKQKAEAENMRLREMLEEQLKITRGLEKVLRKRSSKHTVNDLDENKRRKRIASVEATRYEQLAANLDSRFQEVTAVYEANGLALNRIDFEDIRVVREAESDTRLVEVVFAKVLPFEWARVSAAVWRSSCCSEFQLPHGIYSAQVASTDNLKVTLELSLQAKRQSIVLRSHIALRRRHKEDAEKDVYAWESTSTISSDHKPYDGLQLQAHGWTVVEKLPTEDPTSIVQCCARLAVEESPSTPGILSDVFSEAFSLQYAAMHEMVENMLLEETLGLPKG